MTVKSLIASVTGQEDINFLLTNRIPRTALTRFMGRFSKIEQPLVRDLSIGCLALFTELDLTEAKKSRAVPDQGRAVFAGRPPRRQGSSRRAPQRHFPYAAPDRRHVSPLSRAI
jgi:hypothetical protein